MLMYSFCFEMFLIQLKYLGVYLIHLSVRMYLVLLYILINLTKILTTKLYQEYLKHYIKTSFTHYQAKQWEKS